MSFHTTTGEWMETVFEYHIVALSFFFGLLYPASSSGERHTASTASPHKTGPHSLQSIRSCGLWPLHRFHIILQL